MPMLNKNKFPVPSRKHTSSFPDKISSRYGTSIEDEKRLFYVAITRAEDKLILLDTANNNPNNASPFLSLLFSQSDINTIKKKSNKTNDFWKKEFSNNLTAVDLPIIKIGLSDILIYIDCHFQYGLRRKVEIQPSIGDELGYGKGLHEIIQRRFFNKKSWSDEELIKVVEDNVLIPYQSETIEQDSKKSITERIKTMEALGLFNFDILPEEKIEIILDKGIVEGVIDGVIKNDDGSVSIIDWKSNIHESFLSRYKNQINFYAYALSTKGYKIKDAILVDVGASHKKGSLVKITLSIDLNSFKKIEATFNAAFESIIKEDYSPTPSKLTCTSCDISTLCNYAIN